MATHLALGIDWRTRLLVSTAVRWGESRCLAANDVTLSIHVPRFLRANMSENAYATSEESPGGPGLDAELGAGEAAYNVVTDTVTGLNLRGGGNKFQAKFTAISMALGAVVGVLAAFHYARWNLPSFGAALAGGFLGMLNGIFFSGIFLMVFRGLRSMRGKHN